LYNAPKPSFNVDSVIVTHFKIASEQMGYNVLPPENFVNEEAYNMMYNNDLDRAFRLFDLNISNYPSSHNAYDSMGDYYIAKNDKEKAIIFFTKSLELKEVPATRKKLRNLKLMTNK
jgi:tetratricopeptide (TPR) repeat protein